MIISNILGALFLSTHLISCNYRLILYLEKPWQLQVEAFTDIYVMHCARQLSSENARLIVINGEPRDSLKNNKVLSEIKAGREASSKINEIFLK